MDKKRYCRIEYCENFFGTLDTSVHFFLLPIAGVYRAQWIERIMCHQKFDTAGQPKYLICDRHFNPDTIKWKDGRIALQKGTIPTRFPRPRVHVELLPAPLLLETVDSLENFAEDEKPFISQNSIEDAPDVDVTPDPLLNNRHLRPIRFLRNPPRVILDGEVEPMDQNEGVVNQSSMATAGGNVSNDQMDPLKNERPDVITIANKRYRKIRIIRKPPVTNVVTLAPSGPWDTNRDVENGHAQNPSNRFGCQTLEDRAEDEHRFPKATPTDCKRCHELAIELSQTTIKILAAEQQIIEKDKMIKRKSTKLRFINKELQLNNAVAYDFYANDSNDEPEEELTNGTKTGKIAKKYPKMGRHLPYNERQEFQKEMLASLNQMSDKSALQAMMDIQSFIKQCRDSAV